MEGKEERLSRDRDEESWRDREAFLNKENRLFEPVFFKKQIIFPNSISPLRGP